MKELEEKRPEYVKCIRHASTKKNHLSWCGRRIVGWAFTSIDHAVLTIEQRGRLVPCPGCAKKIRELLTQEQRNEETDD
jgi:hypothetical protein